MRELQKEIAALRGALVIEQVDPLEPSLVHLAFRAGDAE